jgi:hypothetical protein
MVPYLLRAQLASFLGRLIATVLRVKVTIAVEPPRWPTVGLTHPDVIAKYEHLTSCRTCKTPVSIIDRWAVAGQPGYLCHPCFRAEMEARPSPVYCQFCGKVTDGDATKVGSFQACKVCLGRNQSMLPIIQSIESTPEARKLLEAKLESYRGELQVLPSTMEMKRVADRTSYPVEILEFGDNCSVCGESLEDGHALSTWGVVYGHCCVNNDWLIRMLEEARPSPERLKPHFEKLALVD